jgi:hypothetical protein
MSYSVREAVSTLGLDGMRDRGFRTMLRVARRPSARHFVAASLEKRVTLELGNGYQLKSTKSKVLIVSPDGRQSSVDVSTDGMSPDQRDQVVAKMIGDIVTYFDTNKEKIANGRIKGADIGAAVYGIGWLAVMKIFPPLAAIEALSQAIFGVGPGNAAVNTGEYFGSIADEAVTILKGESKQRTSEIIGTMSCLFFIGFMPSGLGIVVFFGADGWTFTKKVGATIGGALEDVVNEIGGAIKDVGEWFGDIGDIL